MAADLFQTAVDPPTQPRTALPAYRSTSDFAKNDPEGYAQAMAHACADDYPDEPPELAEEAYYDPPAGHVAGDNTGETDEF